MVMTSQVLLETRFILSILNKTGPPGPPPREGLEWKEETHRWIRPETGEHYEAGSEDFKEGDTVRWKAKGGKIMEGKVVGFSPKSGKVVIQRGDKKPWAFDPSPFSKVVESGAETVESSTDVEPKESAPKVPAKSPKKRKFNVRQSSAYTNVDKHEALAYYQQDSSIINSDARQGKLNPLVADLVRTAKPIEAGRQVYRGLTQPLQGGEVGAVLPLDAFTSTSRDMGVAEKIAGYGDGNGDVMVIDIGEGVKGFDIDDRDAFKGQGIPKDEWDDEIWEYETLISLGHQFKVESIEPRPEGGRLVRGTVFQGGI